MTQEDSVYIDPFTGVVVFDKSWKNRLFYGSLLIIMIAFIVYLCRLPSGYESQIRDEHRKYEICFVGSIFGSIHHCDKYTRSGNTYYLYKDGKITEIIDSGDRMVEIKQEF